MDALRLVLEAELADSDHDIYLWDVLTGRLGGVFRGHEHFINNIVFTPDGKLVSVSRDKHALVWSIPYEHRTPRELAELVAARVPFRLDGAELVDRD